MLIEEEAKYELFKHKLIPLYKKSSEKELQYCATCKQHTMKRKLKCRALDDYLKFNCIYIDNFHLSMLNCEMFCNENNNVDNKRYSLVEMTLYWGCIICVCFTKRKLMSTSYTTTSISITTKHGRSLSYI